MLAMFLTQINVGLTRNTTNQTVGGVPPETPNQFASRVAQMEEQYQHGPARL